MLLFLAFKIQIYIMTLNCFKDMWWPLEESGQIGVQV